MCDYVVVFKGRHLHVVEFLTSFFTNAQWHIFCSGYSHSPDYHKAGGYICPSDIFYGRPKRAVNTYGKWKVCLHAKWDQNYNVKSCHVHCSGYCELAWRVLCPRVWCWLRGLHPGIRSLMLKTDQPWLLHACHELVPNLAINVFADPAVGAVHVPWSPLLFHRPPLPLWLPSEAQLCEVACLHVRGGAPHWQLQAAGGLQLSGFE